MDETLNSPPRKFGARFFVTILLIVIAAAAGATAMYMLQIRKPLDETVNDNRKMQLGLTGSDTPGGKLADQFVDADGDLIADPPTDASKQIDPPTLFFSYVAQEED